MSLEAAIEKIRACQSPEEKAKRDLEFRLRMIQHEKERAARAKCPECGVDTGKYSHTFRCYYRGL
ncbi:hypothetical protein CNR37_00075 [Pseudomonas phage ventosus]|uniref:Uncharacterized protein n=1 Tax=Pseudomonas phage ventosus TaxID=2048980 RepID=A0A2H4P7X6_9CAUD|nr:hypothetical protein CNR37_00075 [Pseudomonas phage ventosus]